MAFVQDITQAFPIIEHNTFLTVYCGESEAPPRRCSSLPARWRSRESDEECKREPSETCDSEAITDVCTEASDELAMVSDSASTAEDGETWNPWIGWYQLVQEPSPPPPPASQTPLRTALNAKASAWEPAAPDTQFVPKTWRVGKPDKPETLKLWQDSAADIVANMSLALGQVGSVTRVDCRRDGAGWEVSAHITTDGYFQYEGILTVAKESLLQEVEASDCIYLLGQSRTPFPPRHGGFCASLGSMRSTKKACWELYSKGLCPRGCECHWEHPAFMNTVNLTIDIAESMASLAMPCIEYEGTA